MRNVMGTGVLIVPLGLVAAAAGAALGRRLG
jgi:hypothetical protein